MILIWLNKVNVSLREGRFKISSLNFSYFFTIFKKSAGYPTLFEGVFKKRDFLESGNYLMFAGVKWHFFWYNFYNENDW